MAERIGIRSVVLTLVIGILSGSVTMNGPIVLERWFRSEFAYAAANQDLLVLGIREPFGANRAELEGAVVDAFQRNYAQFATHFTTISSDIMPPAYKLAGVSGDVQPGAETRFCTGSGNAPAASAGGRIGVLAIFCGHELIAFNRATIAAAVGPADSALVQMSNILAWQLPPEGGDLMSDFNPPGDPNA